MIDLAPSRRGAIATAIQAAIDSGAKLNMDELSLAVIEWRAQETHETVQGQLDRIHHRRAGDLQAAEPDLTSGTSASGN